MSEEDTVTVGQDLLRIELGGEPSAKSAKEEPAQKSEEKKADSDAEAKKPEETKSESKPEPKQPAEQPKQPAEQPKQQTPPPAPRQSEQPKDAQSSSQGPVIGSRDERRV